MPRPGDAGYVEEDPKLAALVGKPGPNVTFRTLDDRRIDLRESYGRRPVYLKLWATYCIPCRVQTPGFQKGFERYGKQIEFVAVDVGFGEDEQKVRAFASEHGMTMPIAIDNGSLSAWLGLDGTPVHVVIGRDGRVVYSGHQDGPKLDAALQQVAASTSASAAPVSTPAAVAAIRPLRLGDQLTDLQVVDQHGRKVPLYPTPPRAPSALLLTAAWCEDYLKSLEPKRAAACRVGREKVTRLAARKGLSWRVVVSHLWTKPADLQPYAKQLGSGLPVTMDSNGQVFRSLGVQQFPAVALVDADGRLARVVPADADLPRAVADFTR